MDLSAAALARSRARTEAAGGGLFGSDDERNRSRSPRRTEAPQAGAETAQTKATQLRQWDRVAAQALNPSGVSAIESVSLKDLWDVASKGHNKVHYYFTEIAADAETGGPGRVGIGISRTAESLLAAINKLEVDHNKQWIEPAMLQKAMDEVATLKP